jgi:hypothetical protein
MNRWVPGVGVEQGRVPGQHGGGSRRHVARCWPPLLGAALLAACGALTGDEVVGGETHFLITCEGGCGMGLSCIDGVCTRGCEPGYSSCAELASAAACVSAPEDGIERGGFGGTCDVLCTGDADCASLGAGHSCNAGVCRAPASSVPQALPSTGSTRAPLVHAVDADTCASGLRWAGGNTSSAEMLPGSDCVGCHRDTGARPLVMAGTIFTDESSGPRRPQPGIDCFGLEGVTLTLIDAAEHEHSTVTNRAGNFYFEGDGSDFPLPYTARIRWSLNGIENVTSMFNTPYYGGCANCHGSTDAPSAFGRLSNEDPKLVIPQSVIFLPGLYPNSR